MYRSASVPQHNNAVVPILNDIHPQMTITLRGTAHEMIHKMLKTAKKAVG